MAKQDEDSKVVNGKRTSGRGPARDAVGGHKDLFSAWTISRATAPSIAGASEWKRRASELNEEIDVVNAKKPDQSNLNLNNVATY